MICSTGRSQEEFDDQGVGNILWLQKKDGTFLKAPLEMDDADEGVSTHLTLILEIIILCDILIQEFKREGWTETAIILCRLNKSL